MKQGRVGMKVAMATVVAAFVGGAAGTGWAIGPIETVWDGYTGNFGQDRGIQVAQLQRPKKTTEAIFTEEDVSTEEMSQQTYVAKAGQSELSVGQKDRQSDRVMSVSDSGKSRDRVIQVK